MFYLYTTGVRMLSGIAMTGFNTLAVIVRFIMPNLTVARDIQDRSVPIEKLEPYRQDTMHLQLAEFREMESQLYTLQDEDITMDFSGVDWNSEFRELMARQKQPANQIANVAAELDEDTEEIVDHPFLQGLDYTPVAEIEETSTALVIRRPTNDFKNMNVIWERKE